MAAPGTTRLLRALALASLLATACDRADEASGCSDPSDPSTTSGARIDQCKSSTFKITDPRYRALTGKVFAGENTVAGALVQMTTTEGFHADSKVAGAAIATDQGGNYGPIAEGPMHYDILAQFGTTVLVTRGLVFRYFEETIDAPFPVFGPGVPLDLAPVTTNFRSHIDIVPRPILPAGTSLFFFAKGDDAVSVSGDLEHGLTLVGTAFTTKATIYAVAYPTGGDLAGATEYASSPVVVTPQQHNAIALDFQAITTFQNPSIQVSTPPGFTTTSIDLIVAYSRTSRAYLTSLDGSTPKRVPVLPDSVTSAYRVVATAADGRTIESGIVNFGMPDVTTVDLTQVTTPDVASPAPNATIAATEPFVAYGEGMFELRLVPVTAGQPTIHVLTAERSISLPDLTALRAAPHGAYTWTIAAYPTTTIPDNLSGRDARRGTSSAVTATRTVTFQ